MAHLAPGNRRLPAVVVACVVVSAVATAGWAQTDVLTQIARQFPASPRSYAQVGQLLRELSEASPLLTCQSIGQSHNGRDIWLVTATDPRYPAARKTRLFIIARQHGNEPAGTTAVLGLLGHLARAPSATERELLRRVEITAVPVANPDGAVAGRRTNGQRVDLNRDWGKFTQPETQAIRAAIYRGMPHAIVDLHELPATSSRRSYRENFIETIGAHGNLPEALCGHTVAASHNISFWMSKYSYPLNVYYDYPGDSPRLCHRYWGLREGFVSFLCESKTGPGHGLTQRAGFHVLATLGIINYLGRLQLGASGLPISPPHYSPPPAPAAMPSAPPLRPLQVSIRLEPATSADTGRVVVCSQVEGTGRFGFVQISVNGVTRALTNQRDGRYLLDTDALPGGQHVVTAELCDEHGGVLASQRTTLSLPPSEVQVAK